MKKLYIIVDSRLGLAYQGVQGAHAVAQWMIEHPIQAAQWNNSTLIFLKVDTTKWKTRLFTLKIDHSQFLEPDMNNIRTAIACYSDGEIFKDLKLMGQ